MLIMLFVVVVFLLLLHCESYSNRLLSKKCNIYRSNSFNNNYKYKTYLLNNNNNNDNDNSIVSSVSSSLIKKDNKYIITKNGLYKDTSVYIDRMSLLDLHHVVELSTNQFRNRCKDEIEVIQLKLECLMLFLPKLLFPQLMGHSLISIKAPYNHHHHYQNNPNSNNNNKYDDNNDNNDNVIPSVIIGFVDVSLQPCDGTLKSLRNLPLFVRKLLYNNNNSSSSSSSSDNKSSILQPYLCNLLVRPEYRQLGLGKLLISECEKEAESWGYSKLHLHVEKQSASVLGLYLAMNFEPVLDNSNILFMKKDLDVR